MGLDRVTVNRVDDCVVEVAHMLDLPVPVVTNMEQVADNERIIQVDIYVGEADEAPLMQQMPSCFSNRWSPLFTDVNRTGNSKQRGIDIIAAHHRIRRRRQRHLDAAPCRPGHCHGKRRRGRKTERRIHHRRRRQRRRDKSPAPPRAAVTGTTAPAAGTPPTSHGHGKRDNRYTRPLPQKSVKADILPDK